MGSVYKDGQRWGIIYDAPRGADQKRRQVRRRGFKTKREAKDALKIAESGALQGDVPTKAKMTVGELLEQWLQSMDSRQEQGKLARATLDSYQRQVNLHLKPQLGRIPLRSLTPLHLETYFQGASLGRVDGGTLSSRSVYYQYRILSMALSRAVKWRLIPYNPCANIDPPGGTSREPAVLSSLQAQQLISDVIGTWLYLPCLLAIACGLRRGEICGLQWNDLDLGHGTTLIQRSIEVVSRTVAEKPPKSGRAELIALPPSVVDDLKLAKGLSVSQWVVCEEDGSMVHPDRLTCRFRRWAKKAGLAITFHSLRHTHGTVMLDAGVHPMIAQRQLRHSSLEMTGHYSHVQQPMQAEAASLVDEKLGRKRVV